MSSQTSLNTSQRGGCNPLNPPPGSASVLSFLKLKRGAVCKDSVMNRFRNSEVLFHGQSHKVSCEGYLPTCLTKKLSPELSISWVVKSYSRSHRLFRYVNGKANKIGKAFSSGIAFYWHPKWNHLIFNIAEKQISVRAKLWSSVSTERLGYYTLNWNCSWEFEQIPICGSYFSGGNKSAIPGRLVPTGTLSLGNYTFSVVTI